MKLRRLSLLVMTALAIATLSGVAAYENARPRGEGWREIAWPFPRDGWPAGRAFRCGEATCGGDVELYLRPKIGFCNCDTGVADDDEVDRVADLDLISEHFEPFGPGEVTRIGDMSGRSRAYDLVMPGDIRHSAVGFALSRRCDLFVAVAQGQGSVTDVRRAAISFLNSDKTSRWMIAAMDKQ